MKIKSSRTWPGVIALGGVLVAGGCVSRPPTISHVHVGHAVTGVQITPGQQGYFSIAEQRGHEAADAMMQAKSDSNLAALKTDVAKAVHAASSDEDFGLQHSLIMASNHITFAATSADASPNIQKSAPLFATDIARVVERCELIALLGRDVAASTSLQEASVLTTELQALTQANLLGDDSNGDGMVGSAPSEYGLAQLRTELDGMVAREHPAYVTVKRWYLFNLVRLPNGRWVFDKYGRGGNIEGYK